MKIDFFDLADVRALYKDETIVLVGGCYDLLHVGHIAYLEVCRELGDILIVCVSSDSRVKERKGYERPIINQSDRVRMLSALKCVDYALVAPVSSIPKDVPTVLVINKLRPDIFATSDSKFKNYENSLKEIGVKTCYIPDIRLSSTTSIIEKIKCL